MRSPTAALLAPVVILGLVVSACSSGGSTGGATTSVAPAPTDPATIPVTAPPTTLPPPPVIAAVGDIACDPASENFAGGEGTADGCHQMATSELVLDQGYDAFLALGDLQYEAGAADAFVASYDPSWGRVKAITHPAPGNHEYNTAGAAPYYAYFGAAAGDPAKGYYSFDVGDWHIVALNSNCDLVACDAASEQVKWLQADLAAHPATCSLAYWHHPRFSSGEHGSDERMADLYRAADAGGVDVILNGHDHHYERFTPQDADGAPDQDGPREFVVGTGGKNHYLATTPVPNSERIETGTFGVLRLTLRPDGYDWTFVPEAGAAFTDTGAGSCT